MLIPCSVVAYPRSFFGNPHVSHCFWFVSKSRCCAGRVSFGMSPSCSSDAGGDCNPRTGAQRVGCKGFSFCTNLIREKTYIYIYIHIYTYIHIYIYTYIHIYIHIYMAQNHSAGQFPCSLLKLRMAVMHVTPTKASRFGDCVALCSPIQHPTSVHYINLP